MVFFSTVSSSACSTDSTETGASLIISLSIKLNKCYNSQRTLEFEEENEKKKIK